MKTEMKRRDFLKYSAAAGILATTEGSSQSRAAATETPEVTEVDKVTIWVLTDNYYDSTRLDTRIAKRYRSGLGKAIHAEHGVAYYIETVVGSQTSACMFDYGRYTAGILNNLDLLGIDIGKSMAFALSHGHHDHYTAATGIIQRHQSRISPGTPFYAGEEAFSHRYSIRAGEKEVEDYGQFQKSDLETLGLRVIEVKSATQIIPGAFLTGNIARITPYEKVPASLLIQRGEKPEPDDLRGEQGLFINVKGKGLVVLSGCAHAGMVNTVRQAQRVSGTQKVHAILGGLHLTNAKPELIQSTVEDIKAMKPDYIVPMHCSGFEAMAAFSREMPSEFAVNTAGTRYTFTA